MKKISEIPQYKCTKAEAQEAVVVTKCEQPPVATVTPNRVLRVRLVKGIKISIWLELVLLVVRHFCPEVQEQIPAVYQFLDSVTLPIINWLYAIVMKLAQWLLSQAAVQNVLEALKDLAA